MLCCPFCFYSCSPSQTLLYTHLQNGEKQRNCIGSLVTSRFVLTAAHCFRFGDEAEHVKVEIDDGGRSGKDKCLLMPPFFSHPIITQ